MDSNCPPTYVEASSDSSLADTNALISYIRSLTPSPSNALVQPILTPRFAISCSTDLLTGLGRLAADEKAKGTEIAIQTHLGENTGEIAFTKDIFDQVEGWDRTYAGVYDRFGLLGPKTVLAHCVSVHFNLCHLLRLILLLTRPDQVHLEEEELQLIKRTSSGISHCPTSNFNLRSGIAKVADMLDRGIKVGLGTDCSGGYEMGLLSQMRAAVIGSKAIKFNQGERIADLERDMPRSADGGLFSNETHLPLSAVFHMATLGGASLVGLEGTVGNFTVGKEWDAILVDVRKGNGAPAVWFDEEDEPDEGWEEGAFERFVSLLARPLGSRPCSLFRPSLFLAPNRCTARTIETSRRCGSEDERWQVLCSTKHL
jgi:guanine deaminase